MVLAAVRLYNDWDWPAAQQGFKQAIQLNPDLAGARQRYGLVYAISGRRGEALKLLQELRELSRRSYVSPFDMALIHAGLGEKAEALNYLEQAAEERARAPRRKSSRFRKWPGSLSGAA